MLYTYPDYYSEFKCTADSCNDTCCAMWQIVIDEESMEMYKNYDGAFKNELDAGIDYKESVFKQDKRLRCKFLDEKNLCKIYSNMGEKSLCKTCTCYPRHIEEFENIREYNLAISCPEVARIIVSKLSKTNYLEKNREEAEEEYEDYDYLLHSYLNDARVIIKSIIQDRNKPIKERFCIIWKFADNMQRLIDDNEIFVADIFQEAEKIDKYEDNAIKNTGSFDEDMFSYSKNICSILWKLEMISDDWQYQLAEVDTILYGLEKTEYLKLSREFEEWIASSFIQYEIVLEQIALYFIYSYMCGAVYDGYVSSKVRLSISSTWFISEMIKARWIKNDKVIDIEDIIYMTYKYSRQLEHSDDNILLFEELLDEI